MTSLAAPLDPLTTLSPQILGKGKGSGRVNKQSQVDIIDIRDGVVQFNLKEEIHRLFRPQEGYRKLPTLLLYDEKGLQLFEDITYLQEYYLTNYEIQVLRRSAAAIAKTIPTGAMVIELGSGNLRKVAHILQALEDAGKKVDYYALDLSKQELSRTLAQLPNYKYVRCHGLLGTYDDGREWLKRPAVSSRPKCIMSLGSSIGNFGRYEAVEFLRGFSEVLQPSDTLLIGVDSCSNPSKIYHAYNDREGVTHQFILNGLEHANEILGEEAFKLDDWRVIGEYVYDAEGGRHQAFYAPKRDVVVMGETIRPHERIQVEQSLKFSLEECEGLWSDAGLKETKSWMNQDGDYGLHLLSKSSTMSFSLNPSEYASTVVPSLRDWEGVWAAWDAVTRQMLPREGLLDKPINLRNACIFYLGHIPAFLDIQLCKVLPGPAAVPTEPASYHAIFERGIDPDVDNPERCHQHSEIPDEWPLVDDILVYQGRVRARLAGLYQRPGADGKEDAFFSTPSFSRDLGRAIWVGFEHELMHLETLLYMMLQSDKTLPPPGVPQPDFAALARRARAARVENEWFDVPKREVTLGLDDPEDVPTFDGHFGWDNEKPTRKVKVHGFQAKGRAITNEEYARYMHDNNVTNLPASWVKTQPQEETNGVNGDTNGLSNGHANAPADDDESDNGQQKPQLQEDSVLPAEFVTDKAVRTVYGAVPLRHALDWPVFASYDELAGCAAWMGGRIPTVEEARSIYAHVDEHRRRRQKVDAENQLGKTVPAVNGHLINDGVEETPPSQKRKQGSGPGQQDLFADLGDANVGFRHWQPVAVTGRGDRLAGRAEMGGVWEWTSSVLRPHEGFRPMKLYPGYTADFFDEKHNIVLGGSWATHPRIAGRKSFVNWYQRNYPYAWAGGRLVRDI